MSQLSRHTGIKNASIQSERRPSGSLPRLDKRLNLIPVQRGNHGYLYGPIADSDTGEDPRSLFHHFPAYKGSSSGLGGQRRLNLRRSRSLKGPRDRDRSSKLFEVYRKVEFEHEGETYSIWHVIRVRKSVSFTLHTRHSWHTRSRHYSPVSSREEGTKLRCFVVERGSIYKIVFSL